MSFGGAKVSAEEGDGCWTEGCGGCFMAFRGGFGCFLSRLRGSASCMSFDACERRILIHSVPFPRLGILGALGFVMSYFIVCLLFRRNLV